MCCGLGEEERTKIWTKKKEKKREKKEINLIAAKSGLVGMKGYLETYDPMNIGVARIFDWGGPKPQITCNDVIENFQKRNFL